MKIVIDLPEEVYKDAKEHMNCEWGSIIAIHNALNNCTVLPKGHGDLKDVAEIERLWQKGDYDSLTSALIFAPTVIEADKAESEG